MSNKPVMLLLGAEGVAEVRQSPNSGSWFHEADSEEQKAFRIQLLEYCKKNNVLEESMLTDGDVGRPYFPVVVDPCAPASIYEKAQRYMRLVRF